MTVIIVMSLIIFIVASQVRINSVVHGQGVIVTKDNAQLISLSKGGTIDKIYVSEGSMVKKGDLLARVVNLDLQKEYERINAQRDNLAKNVTELSFVLDILQQEKLSNILSENKLMTITNKEVVANIDLVASQIKTKELKKNALRSEIEGLNKHYSSKKEEMVLLTEEVDILQPLVKKGVSPYTNFLNKKQTLVKLGSEFNEIVNNIKSKENEIDLVTSDIKSVNYELSLSLAKQLSREQQELDIINSTLKIVVQQLEEEKIYSPVNGVIYRINKNASTPGGVIQPADLLFEIKPIENIMLAEVKVNPKFRDQLYVGEPVKLNVLSTIYVSSKTYDAVIEKISPDSYEDTTSGALQRYYKIVIVFNVNDDDLNWLKQGMTVEANVVTGKHSVMEYIISPLIKGIGSMFSETIHASQ